MSLDSRALSDSEFSLIQSLAAKRKRETAPVSRTSDAGTDSEDCGESKVIGTRYLLSKNHAYKNVEAQISEKKRTN